MDDPLDLLCDFIRLGRAGEAAVQAIVAERLAALGCKVEALRYRPAEITLHEEFAATSAAGQEERTAVIARFAGTGGGRSCILFAHPDGEPVPAEHGWRFDPFTARLVDGRLHGWGVADDLAGVAAMVSALALVRADGWQPRGDIVIASTPSKRHARGAAAVLDRIARPDAAIYLHPAESGAGMGEVKACTPGLLEFIVEVQGRAPGTAEPGHAAFAHRGLNAADAVMSVVQSLMALDAERGARIRHERIERFIGRATNLLISGLRLGNESSRNRVPVGGIVEGSVSFPPGEKLDSVLEEVRQAVASASLHRGWPDDLRPSVTFPAGVAGAEIEPTHPLFLAADAAIRAETGRSAFVNPVHTASDIRVPILQRNIPTIGLGPLAGDLSQNSRTEEWVDAEDHRRCVRVVAALLRTWCG